MPDEKAPLRKAVPPPSGRAKAAGKIDPPDAEERVESLAPDDDLSDYIVPQDEPEEIPAPAGAVPSAPGDNNVGEVRPDVAPITTADTELVRQLRAELARAEARLNGQVADIDNWSSGNAPVEPQPGEKVLIHVRKDGFTSNGLVWYTGQEIEFTVGEANWKATCDRYGKSWVLLSESEQIRRYGEVQFGHGPWPGATYDSEKAAAAERRRGRAAPTIPELSSQKQLRI